jgi:hypothetical protein
MVLVLLPAMASTTTALITAGTASPTRHPMKRESGQGRAVIRPVSHPINLFNTCYAAFLCSLLPIIIYDNIQIPLKFTTSIYRLTMI